MPVRLVSDEELPGPLKGYRLIERLGRGGFGEVWKCEAPGGLFKAMKFVFGDLDAIDDDESRPAEQELKSLNRVKSIRHPYILSIERYDKIDGQLIITMELADKNLWDRFRECRAQGMIGIPREELLRYLEESAEALDLMNQHYQIQHLDVKPQNIFLVYNHVKVADFGLAKDFEGARGTITGGVTPVYAAPETFEGYVSRFTDQYSLAIVFQELLTGRRPFEGSNTKQLLMQHLNGVPDLASLSEADRLIIARALSKSPDDRWPTSSEMIAALRGSVGGNALQFSLPQQTPSKDDTPLPLGANVVTQQAIVLAQQVPPSAAVTQPTARVPIVRPGSGTVGPLIRTTLPQSTQQTLTTPKLVTPKSVSLSHSLRALGEGLDVQQTGRMSTLGIAPPEKTGPGVLKPALIIGVGGTGLAILKLLRQFMIEQQGTLSALPNLRFLYIDTDAEATQKAQEGLDALTAKEVITTKLNRPTHYLQSNTIADVNQWMPPGMLYQLPKNAAPTGGVRCYGRLALCDHYKLIVQRIRQEVEPFLTDDLLNHTASNTGLGLRDNRLRAYIVAGTTGGTGSGMFLDLGYIVRNELQAFGYRDPETVGVLMVPAAEASTPKGVPLANTYSALAELYNYGNGQKYFSKFDPEEQPLTSEAGPFARTVLQQLSGSSRPREQVEALGNAARVIFTELLTTAGRTTDYVRAVAPAPKKTQLPVISSIGLYRLNWPRTEMLTGASRYFNRQLMQRWSGREATHLKEPLAKWLDDLWAKRQLSPDSIVKQLHSAAGEALRETPEAVFSAAVDSLRTRTPAAGKLDAAAACTVLDQLIRLVGKPTSEQEEPSGLEAAIQAHSLKMCHELESELSSLAVSFIEQPQYRIAGAEEAFNQMSARLKETLSAVETQHEEIRKDVQSLFSRVLQLIGTLQTTTGLANLPGRKSAITHELYEALQQYPARRLRSLEISAATTLYRSLLGNMPEFLRDVNFCRTKLKELHDSFAEPPKSETPFLRGQLILPQGCTTILAAVEQVIDALPADEMLAYDQTLQKLMMAKFKGLAGLCLKAENTSKFVELLTQQTRAFLDARLEKTNPSTILLRYFGQGQATTEKLRRAFDKAEPVVKPHGEKPLEANVLAMPSDASGDPVRQLLQHACEGVEFIPSAFDQEILFHREYLHVPLARVPQLGQHACEAYEQQRRNDVALHSRADIRWTEPPRD